MAGVFKPVAWEWKGDCKILTSHAICQDGYGQMHFEGKRHRLHRVVWAASNGPIPKGMCILHSCDRPACFNLDHLSLGTTQENTRQRDDRGRGADRKGEKSGTAKLTGRTAWLVRYQAKGIRNSLIAKNLGVDVKTIYNVRNNRTWTNIEEPMFTLEQNDLDFIESLR